MMIIYDDRIMISYDDRDMGLGQDRDMGPGRDWDMGRDRDMERNRDRDVGLDGTGTWDGTGLTYGVFRHETFTPIAIFPTKRFFNVWASKNLCVFL